MKDFKNKTAVITGAASGIGLALTYALLERGANVMMCDINADSLEEAAAAVAASDYIGTVICDVADHDSVIAASQATIDRFGKVHFLFNNAGVSLAGKNGSIAIEDWRWIVDINLMGVVHGTEVFLPLIRAHEEGGHIINTASMAGHVTSAFMSPYHATKFAVVGYSESLREELKDSDIGISVLCPTWVKSNIHNAQHDAPSHAHMQSDFSNSKVYQMTKQLIDNGMSAENFASLALSAIDQDRFYVFNDPTVRDTIDSRRDHILADYDACLADAAAYL